nr:MAG TPA: hypothetical protein [Caudoviricetes sp.]
MNLSHFIGAWLLIVHLSLLFLNIHTYSFELCCS